ncbi:MAG TPA: ABC transporter substrate binding protein, partial [Casimicrobiaceae bacterium]|nr:ABC transporter substrate binding protein [Casimicrobiaceae bacterium]
TFFSSRGQLIELTAKRRLPSIYGTRQYADDGALMTYGANIAANWRRAATYVDKILKGAQPGELPIEQAASHELVINLKAATALGITIPQALLQRADDVIR